MAGLTVSRSDKTDLVTSFVNPEQTFSSLQLLFISLQTKRSVQQRIYYGTYFTKYHEIKSTVINFITAKYLGLITNF